MNREKDQTLAFSVLLTREEYTQTIARIEQENRGRRLPLPTMAGALLTAMGIDSDRAECALRFSLSPYTTIEEIDYAAEKLGALYGQLKRFKRR